jgi:hypothetical protein
MHNHVLNDYLYCTGGSTSTEESIRWRAMWVPRSVGTEREGDVDELANVGDDEGEADFWNLHTVTEVL